jgi:hypothetical protein
MKTIPKWMQNLTLNALIEFKPDADVPILKISHISYQTSSGWCGDKEIKINIGTDRKDAKLVLLHELTHWMLPRIKKLYGYGIWQREMVTVTGHTPEFWDLAWSLYRWAKLPVAYCKSREFNYKAGAKDGYLRSRNKES